MLFFNRYKEQYKQILLLAFPVVLAQIGVILVQLFDNAMVGRLGALPLAAVSFGGTVFFLLFIFLYGAVFALTPLVGKKYVQGDSVGVAAYLQNSLLLFSLTAVFACFTFYAIIPLMYHMGQPTEVVDLSIPYYKWISLSIVPFLIFASFKQFFEGVGDTKVNLIVIMFSSLLNIFLNWVFIYGNLGFQAMGVEGAGLATFLSRLVMPFMAVLFFCLFSKFKVYLSLFNTNYINWKSISLILSLGIPIALQMFMEGAAFAITSIMMGWIGTVEIAANQIALTISNFSFMIIIGLSVATTIRISHTSGRNDLEEMKKISKASFHLVLLYSTLTALVFIIFRVWIVGVFTTDPEVIKLASYLFIFVAAFQFSDGLQIASVGILRGMEDVKRVMIIAFIAYILINLPVGYFLTFVLDFGAGGLWSGFIIGLSVAAFLLIIRIRKQFRRMSDKAKLKSVEDDAVAR